MDFNQSNNLRGQSNQSSLAGLSLGGGSGHGNQPRFPVAQQWQHSHANMQGQRMMPPGFGMQMQQAGMYGQQHPIGQQHQQWQPRQPSSGGMQMYGRPMMTAQQYPSAAMQQQHPVMAGVQQRPTTQGGVGAPAVGPDKKRKEMIANSFKAVAGKSGKSLADSLLNKTDLELTSYAGKGHKDNRQAASLVFAPRRYMETKPQPHDDLHEQAASHASDPAIGFGFSNAGAMMAPSLSVSTPASKEGDDFGDFQQGQASVFPNTVFSNSTPAAFSQSQVSSVTIQSPSPAPQPLLPQSGPEVDIFADLIPKNTIQGSAFVTQSQIPISNNPQMSEIPFQSAASDAQRPIDAPSSSVMPAGIPPTSDDVGPASPYIDTADDLSSSHAMDNAKKSTDLHTQLYGCQLPSWTSDVTALPTIYRKIYEKCLSDDGTLSTSEVRSILLQSYLPKETLASIWEQSNRIMPGTLVPEELFTILGLVALAQAGWNKLTIAKLASCSPPPIPEFPEYMFIGKGESVFDPTDGIDESPRKDDDVPLSPVDPTDRYSVFKSLAKHDRAPGDSNVTPSTSEIGQPVILPTTVPQNEVPPSSSSLSTDQPATAADDWASFSDASQSNNLSASNSNPPSVFAMAKSDASAINRLDFSSVLPPMSAAAAPVYVPSSNTSGTLLQGSPSGQFQSSSVDSDDFGDFQTGNSASSLGKWNASQEQQPVCSASFPSVSSASQSIPLYEDVARLTSDHPRPSWSEASSFGGATTMSDEADDFGDFETAAPVSQGSHGDPFDRVPHGGGLPFGTMAATMATTQLQDHSITSNASVTDATHQGVSGMPSTTNNLTEMFSSLTFLPAATSATPAQTKLNEKSVINNDVIHSWLTATSKQNDNAVAVATTPRTTATTPAASDVTPSTNESVVVPRLPDTDRYKALTGEIQDGERHVLEWARCMRSAATVFKTAISSIHAVTLPKEIKQEIVSTAKGEGYFNALKQIYCVVARLRTSIQYSALAKTNVELLDLSRRIEEMWTDIQQSLHGILPLPQSVDMQACYAVDLNPEQACGVCLLDTERTMDDYEAYDLSFAHLSYSGKTYHSTCANFWCNKVNSVLPALPLLSSGLL